MVQLWTLAGTPSHTETFPEATLVFVFCIIVVLKFKYSLQFEVTCSLVSLDSVDWTAVFTCWSGLFLLRSIGCRTLRVSVVLYSWWSSRLSLGPLSLLYYFIISSQTQDQSEFSCVVIKKTKPGILAPHVILCKIYWVLLTSRRIVHTWCWVLMLIKEHSPLMRHWGTIRISGH